MNPTQFVPKGVAYRDLEDKVRQESRNVVIQAKFVIHTASNWNPDSRVTPDLLKELQRLAVNQIYRCAGFFRDGVVKLEGGTHQPPPHEQVPGLVDLMCEYVNYNWQNATAAPLCLFDVEDELDTSVLWWKWTDLAGNFLPRPLCEIGLRASRHKDHSRVDRRRSRSVL